MLTTSGLKPAPKVQQKTDRFPELSSFKSQEQEISPAVKIAIVGGFLLALIAFTTAALLSRTLVVEKKSRAGLEASRVHLEDEIDALKGQNGDLQTQISRLQEQVKTYSVENFRLKKEFDQASIELSNTRKKVSILEDQNQKLTGELVQAKKDLEKIPAFSAASTAPNPFTNLPAESQSETPLPATGSEVAVATTLAVPLIEDAKVMTVNRKFNFVVINLGLKDNLRIGDSLVVIRENKPIASIQVEKLYDRFAAAAITEGSEKEKIEKGDRIQKA